MVLAPATEQLAPVRARGEGRERRLEVGEHPQDGVRLERPGEVEADRVALVLRAHPQPVGGDRADLAHLEQRADAVRQRAHGLQRGGRVLARHEVLALELRAAARGEAHAEVRQAVRPRAGPAELGRAVDRVEAEDQVPLDRRRARAEEVVPHGLGRVGHAALDPHLVDRVTPARQHAHAVAGAGDRVEGLEQPVPRELLEHTLAHLVGGLDVEREAGDDAERAEADDETVEVRVAARGGDDLAARRDHLQGGDRRREVAVRVPRPVGGGRDRAGDRDVRERGKVVQRHPVGVEGGGQLAVGDARAEGDGAARVEDDVGRERGERHQVGRRRRCR